MTSSITAVSRVNYCTTVNPPEGYPLTVTVHGDIVQDIVFHDPDSLAKFGNALYGAWVNITE